MAARLGLAFVLLLAALTGYGRAEPLARLHVQSFTLSSETMRPKAGEPFNVTLEIRVRENVRGPFDNVILPTFVGPEELGDERIVTHTSSGTVYRETLRLEAHARGPLAIGSAYLDAIDARDGKPKRFISNDLLLNVEGGPAFDVWAPVLALLRGMLELLLAAAAVFVIVTMFRRRRPQPVIENPAPAPASALPALPDDEMLRIELTALDAKRDRESVLRVRAALWKSMGAHDGETLADVLRRPGGQSPRRRRLLMLVERAAFVEEARLPQAIAGVLEERESSFA